MTRRTPTEIMDDPTTSYWLRRALEDTKNRDPIDAYDDVSVLFEICKDRLTRALQSSVSRENV